MVTTGSQRVTHKPVRIIFLWLTLALQGDLQHALLKAVSKLLCCNLCSVNRTVGGGGPPHSYGTRWFRVRVTGIGPQLALLSTVVHDAKLSYELSLRKITERRRFVTPCHGVQGDSQLRVWCCFRMILKWHFCNFTCNSVGSIGVQDDPQIWIQWCAHESKTLEFLYVSTGWFATDFTVSLVDTVVSYSNPRAG